MGFSGSGASSGEGLVVVLVAPAAALFSVVSAVALPLLSLPVAT